jgi:hypothetical protein
MLGARMGPILCRWQMRASDWFALLVVWAMTSLPLMMIVNLGDHMNDKPWGYHATPASYWRAAGIGLVVAAVAGVAARRGDRAGRWARCFCLGWVMAALLTVAFCLCGVPVLMEDRNHMWYK